MTDAAAALAPSVSFEATNSAGEVTKIAKQ
jgi:hypothetical protein